LVLRGFNVVGLYDPFPEAIKYLQQQGGIEMIGDIVSGFAKIPLISTDMEAVVKNADIIMVVVPAYAHEFMAKELAKYVKPHQIVILNPGYFGGAIYFKKVFDEMGVSCKVIAETVILLYATRIVGPGAVGIQDIKKWLLIAALPRVAAKEIVDLLHPVFPQFEAADNVWVTSINNTNPMGHVPGYLFNLGRIASEGSQFVGDFSEWTKAPEIKRVSHALDQERIKVANALGVKAIYEEEWFERSYGKTKKPVVQRVGEVPNNASLVAERYVTEDVPFGLIPLLSLGEQIGVDMPITKALIDLACVAKDKNFWDNARTIERLGLANLDAAAIRAAVE